MEFKKTTITRKDLEAFAKKFWQKYIDTNTGDAIRDIERSLEELVFNVEEEFNPDGWNVCTVMPTSEYFFCDVIVRKRGVELNASKCSSDNGAYKLAYLDVETSPGKCLFMRNDYSILEYSALPKYEYKLIK